MKKFVYLLILLSFPLGLILNNSTYCFYETFKNLKNATFCYVYSAEEYETSLNKVLSANATPVKSLKNGSKQFVYFKDINSSLKEISPEYMQVEADISANNLAGILKKINAKLVLKEQYETVEVSYYYTSVWKNFRVLGGKKVNLQIAINQNVVTMGYPMIYGAF